MACGQCNVCMCNGDNRLNYALMMMVFQMIFMGVGIASLALVFYVMIKFRPFYLFECDFIEWDYMWMVFSMGIIYISIHASIFFVCLAITDWRIFFRYQMCLQVLIFFTMFATIYFDVVILAATIMTKNYKNTIRKKFTMAYKNLMRKYKIDYKIKKFIDDYQLENQCCGAEVFSDWYYLNRTRAQTDIKTIKDIQLPYSCCSLKYMGPCEIYNYDNNSLSHDSSNVYYHYHQSLSLQNVELSVNRVGCFRHVNDYLIYWMNLFLNIYLFSAIIELINMIFFRYLQSSQDVAMLYADPDQTAPGYLCIFCGTTPLPPGFDLDYEQLAIDQQKMQELAYTDDTELLMADMKLKREQIDLLNKLEKDEMVSDVKKQLTKRMKGYESSSSDENENENHIYNIKSLNSRKSRNGRNNRLNLCNNFIKNNENLKHTFRKKNKKNITKIMEDKKNINKIMENKNTKMKRKRDSNDNNADTSSINTSKTTEYFSPNTKKTSLSHKKNKCIRELKVPCNGKKRHKIDDISINLCQSKGPSSCTSYRSLSSLSKLSWNPHFCEKDKNNKPIVFAKNEENHEENKNELRSVTSV